MQRCWSQRAWCQRVCSEFLHLGLRKIDLYNDMLHTSYSQGKQEETFKKIKVKYYYHPDKGLNVSYYRIK